MLRRNQANTIKIVECPRDAMQGIKDFIPTTQKIAYLQQLLEVGFDTLDFGSFVSAKAIPQMRDTPEVLAALDLSRTSTKRLAIVANLRGALEAAQYKAIDYLGYPFSISETFQLRNTNASIEESVELVRDMQSVCVNTGKQLVIYISMGFGNPYGDEWNVEIVQKWTERLHGMGIRILSLSDTIGVSNPQNIAYLFSKLVPAYKDIEFGAHLHTERHNWREKIEAAYLNGCRRFDAAINGFGGCPMAKDDLTGNIATENLLYYFKTMNEDLGLNEAAFAKSMLMAAEIFPLHT